MLETIREFVAERLAGRPDAAEIERRHADYYRALAEQADLPLRGAGQLQWCGRLEAEAGNVAATVHWYLTHATLPLPHLFRVLWLLWFLRDHLGEARSWVGQMLPTARSLDLWGRVELAWTAAAAGVEVGDDQAALAAREHLAPLLDGIWTALTAFTADLVETTVGRYNDALRHLSEMRDLAEQLDNSWLSAVSRVYLGILARLACCSLRSAPAESRGGRRPEPTAADCRQESQPAHKLMGSSEPAET